METAAEKWIVLVFKGRDNIRYEDYKKDFYKKCTKEFAEKNIEEIKELRTWLQQKIKS